MHTEKVEAAGCGVETPVLQAIWLPDHDRSSDVTARCQHLVFSHRCAEHMVAVTD